MPLWLIASRPGVEIGGPSWSAVALFLALAVGGLLYAHHIARAFDRKWGRPEDWG
ncbi:hypothetical protein [Methylobacterium sp. Gmos1]